MTVTIRKAQEKDRERIAHISAESFKEDFAVLTRNLSKVKEILVHDMNLQQFYVAETDGEVVGNLALTNNTTRAFSICSRHMIDLLGLVRGGIGSLFLKKMFSEPLRVPDEIGYFEFVAVDASARRQGIASKMIQSAAAMTAYPQYMLDTDFDNAAAIRVYRKLGFQEIAHGREWFRIIFGFSRRIFLQASRESLTDH
jgi:ribosomal protein S18 acetylase RimI-like enzyme